MRFIDNKEKLYKYAVYLILIIGILIRIVGITDMPNALNCDEASAGYEAFSLLNYGIDRNGNHNPSFLVAWGSGQNALLTYLIIPLIKIFGLKTIAIRLPMAILGCVSLVILYLLLRKIKNNGSTDKSTQNTENPWQAKVYKNPIGKRIVDLFIPKKGTKDFIKVQKLLKDSASKLKMEWLYVNRITIAILTFLISIFLFVELHITSINWIYTEPTTDYDIMGGVTGSELQEAMAKTESDNKFLDMFRGNTKTTVQDIQKAMERSKDYADSDEEEIETSAKRVYDKLQKVNKEYLGWFEVLLAVVFMIVAYMAPIWIMYFQLKMRQMEMEDEVMQFQTIILMLMRIERVNVEIILEWLERYANIFKEPISRCVNNYEAGAWEALEELKNATNYQQFIRIVESLQAAVEKIPIRDAFDELDSERDYYQAKRRESNDRLIAKKARIGKLIGFTPMVVMFVGYLIVPLVVIGLTSMTSSMASLQ